MNVRNSAMLLAAAGALTLVFWFLQPSDYTPPDSAPPLILALRGVDPARAREVVLRQGEREVRLERRDTGWVVPTSWMARADSQQLARLLEALASVSEPEVRAEDARNHERLGIDAASGVHVEVRGDGEPFPVRIVLGNSDPGARRCFLRAPDSALVYSVHPDLRQAGSFYGTGLNAAYYLDRELTQPSPGARITALDMTQPDGRVRIEAPPGADGDWQVTAPESFPARAEAVAAVLERVARVAAVDVVDPGRRADHGLEAPEHVLRVERDAGPPMVLRFGKEAPGNCVYAEREGDERVFTVHAFVRNGLFRSLAELRDGPTTRADPAGARSRPR